MADKWLYVGDWHVQGENGQAVNLNTAEGADYVLALLGRVSELEEALAALEGSQRVRRRRKREEAEG